MKLNASQIADALQKLDGWEQNGAVISKSYQFADFAHAMIFVNYVADLAEAADHHPDIFINYNKVLLELFTHSEDGLTRQDFALARAIDEGVSGEEVSSE